MWTAIYSGRGPTGSGTDRGNGPLRGSRAQWVHLVFHLPLHHLAHRRGAAPVWGPGRPHPSAQLPHRPALLCGRAPAAGIEYNAPNKPTASKCRLRLACFHNFNIFCIMVRHNTPNLNMKESPSEQAAIIPHLVKKGSPTTCKTTDSVGIHGNSGNESVKT